MGHLKTKIIAPTADFKRVTLLISGVKSDDDAMCGEETQLVGCRCENMAEKQLFLYPGMHAKHVLVRYGRAVSLKTYMTSESFALVPTKGILADPVTDEHLRFNDGKCDPAGRFWVGTFDLLGRDHIGTLYRFDPDGSTHIMLRHITNSNGIVWSLDKTAMYYSDTPTRMVQAFDYDNAIGTIANPRIVVRFPKNIGWPDGMTIDAEGNINLHGRAGLHVMHKGQGHCYVRFSRVFLRCRWLAVLRHAQADLHIDRPYWVVEHEVGPQSGRARRPLRADVEYLRRGYIQIRRVEFAGSTRASACRWAAFRAAD